MRPLLVLVLGLMLFRGAMFDTRAQSPPSVPPESVDDLLASMSNVDKVGQLFMLSFSGSTSAGALTAIQEFRAGGLVFIVNTSTADSARSAHCRPAGASGGEQCAAVIGTRAFSDDPDVVASLGQAYIEGLQSQGVRAVGKHFPGHGSTTADSHLQLPVVNHDLKRSLRN